MILLLIVAVLLVLAILTLVAIIQFRRNRIKADRERCVPAVAYLRSIPRLITPGISQQDSDGAIQLLPQGADAYDRDQWITVRYCRTCGNLELILIVDSTPRYRQFDLAALGYGAKGSLTVCAIRSDSVTPATWHR